MKPPLYYSIRVTTPEGSCTRRIAHIPKHEAPNTEVFRLAGPNDTVEYKYLGSGIPFHVALGPMCRAFHTADQRISYECGLQGHGVRPIDKGALDDFSYLGEIDAEVIWDNQLKNVKKH